MTRAKANYAATGAGQRALELEPVKEFWYTSFHQLDLAKKLIDGAWDSTRGR
jgi:hypothetical protein